MIVGPSVSARVIYTLWILVRQVSAESSVGNDHRYFCSDILAAFLIVQEVNEARYVLSGWEDR